MVWIRRKMAEKQEKKKTSRQKHMNSSIAEDTEKRRMDRRDGKACCSRNNERGKKYIKQRVKLRRKLHLNTPTAKINRYRRRRQRLDRKENEAENRKEN